MGGHFLSFIIAQALVPKEDMWLELMKQGGFFACLLIVLFFYRKDFMKKDEERDKKEEQMLKIIEDNTEATRDQTVALVELKAANERLSRAVEVGNFSLEVGRANKHRPNT